MRQFSCYIKRKNLKMMIILSLTILKSLAKELIIENCKVMFSLTENYEDIILDDL